MAQTKSSKITKAVDTKLATLTLTNPNTVTRAELVDMVVEDVLSGLEKERASIDKRMGERRGRAYTLEELELHPGATFQLRYNNEIAVSVKSEVMVNHYRHLQALEKQHRAVSNQIYQLTNDRRKVKAEITKRILESTAEGKALLGMVVGSCAAVVSMTKAK